LILHVLSDLHTEFGAGKLPKPLADVVILAGDIGPKLSGLRYATQIFGTKRPILYVAGNHEYYGACMPALTSKLRKITTDTNVYFFNNDQLIINDVRFLGCTMWTDFGLFGSDKVKSSMEFAQETMSDYRTIRRGAFKRITPGDILKAHEESRKWLKERLDEMHRGPTVVITHHAPSRQSIRPEERTDPVSAAYATNLEELMDGHRVELWIHGHTHYQCDYIVKGTRVLANQLGYPGEQKGFKSDLTVKVGE
jgi:predicted phosphohydrolase